MKSLNKYAAFFGREPDLIAPPIDDFSIYSYRFLPRNANFFQRIFTQLPKNVVVITDGLSNFEMTLPKEIEHTFPKRIELIAVAEGLITAGEEQIDVLTALLQTIASGVTTEKRFLGPMHTIDFGEKICTNSDMSCFLLAIPDRVDMNRLCSCTQKAKLVISIMPIYSSELDFVKENDFEKLISLFEKNNIPNIFNPFRPRVI